ncbi:hypothetical protein [Rodentibacter caecimuris]|uniref:hypothetical protein n=1 Tax=Rodentibacter caecimuris TaxID=1796644 RepID=UPI0009842BC5|nr:hypothetical protein BKG97_01930 [Rodentibacter heylii]
MTRKIIQICESAIPATVTHSAEWSLTALCDDGTVWNKSTINKPWVQIENVPQDKQTEQIPETTE